MSQRTTYNEQSAVYLDISFIDTDNTPYIPTNIQFQVNDSETGQLMQSSTPVSPGSSVQIRVNASANVINDSNNAVEHRTVTITADDGTEAEHNEVYKYSLRNFNFV